MADVKKVLVCGAGGFLGSHLINRLKKEGFWVRGVDLKHPEFETTTADEFIIGDLRNQDFCHSIFDTTYLHVYQLAADMGGAGYIFTGENDADVMYNSALINLNILDLCRQTKVGKVFYSSSACIYPSHNQQSSVAPVCSEDSAYPANPDSEYGWEKLFSERLYLSFMRNHGLSVRVARFHNVFGPQGTWQGGREKAPAALCRKVAMARDGGEIEIWGDGNQTRSFLYVDECIEGIRRLMEGDWEGPVNIGSEEMISINDFAKLIIAISGKKINIKHIDGPTGVKGRNSDNRLIAEKLGWQPNYPLIKGAEKTYQWIAEQVRQQSPALVLS
jgi:nucleoside-diphosphate-sugar epimerase